MTLVGVSGPSAFAAQDELAKVQAAAGKQWYDKFCTPCHGPGGQPGTAVSRANKQPVDLRTYVKRNGGKFPVGRWIQVVQDVNPGGVHADVWQSIMNSQTGMISNETAARGILASIASYVRSIQTK
jgi:hypothetical protein